MRPSRSIAISCPGAVLLTILSIAPAAAAAVPDYEAPFPCGEQWVGTTRSSHSPSAYSVDFNRPDDIGDLAVASAPGVVTRVTDTGSSSYGKYIIVDHGDGNTSLYAHLLAQYVTTGQRVDQGTILGLVGTSGGSTGPHLHFEQRFTNGVRKPFFHQAAYRFGTALASRNCPDVPLAGNWDGRGGDEVAVFRRGVGTGVFRLYRPGMLPSRVEFGYSADTPLTGDWDGDGRTDVGVRTSGTTSFVLRKANGTKSTVSFGRVVDVPITGDWDGNGVSEVGVWRPDVARFRLRRAPGVVARVNLGTTGALPLTGDWNGDGITDVGVFDPATRKVTLRTQRAGSAATLQTIAFGAKTDLPVTGDWNGDGRTDIGTWAPGTATYTMRVPTAPAAQTTRITTQRFGTPRVG